MFRNDPKFRAFRSNVAKIVKRDAEVNLSALTEPMPGWFEGEYCDGSRPELTALELIEFNIGLGNL